MGRRRQSGEGSEERRVTTRSPVPKTVLSFIIHFLVQGITGPGSGP